MPLDEQHARVLRLYRDARDWAELARGCGGVSDEEFDVVERAVRAAREGAFRDLKEALAVLADREQLLVNVLAGPDDTETGAGE